MGTSIHPTAVIDSKAELGTDVSVGPYTVIGADVYIGDRTEIGAHVVINGTTQIGSDNIIIGQTSLGGAPQDFSYRGEPTRLIIGNGNTIREFVTINRGTIKGGGQTLVGDNNLLMACSHVGHDCEIDDHTILGNGVLLAGHVRVEHHANLSGMAGAVAFVTVGAHSYVGAMTRMSRDVPPFMIVEGHDSRVRGVNVIGLERSGFSPEDSSALRAAFRRVFRSGQPRRTVLEELRAEDSINPHVRTLVEAMSLTEIGYKGRYRESLREEFKRLGVERILAGSPS